MPEPVGPEVDRSELGGLEPLGWDAQWQTQWQALGHAQPRALQQAQLQAQRQAGLDRLPNRNLLPARVTRIDKGGLTVNTRLSDPTLTVAASGARGCAVGDWVAIDSVTGRIESILPRRTVFLRRAPGVSRGQLALQTRALAANMDRVLVLQPLDAGLNERRLSRELVLAWESGATPHVVLTKVDAVSQHEVVDQLAAAKANAPGVAVTAVSNRTGAGLDALTEILGENSTIALLGSSGAGKSSLVNALAGREVQLTAEVRADDRRGRHTTTAGQLISLDGGRLLIDTPGIRAVGLWEADHGLEMAFADLSPYVQTCRFEDCSHEFEPDCGLIAAVENGSVPANRVEQWRELVHEVAKLEEELEELHRAQTRETNQRSRNKARRRTSRQDTHDQPSGRGHGRSGKDA